MTENKLQINLTEEWIRTPRGCFRVADMTAEQMEKIGYGLHHVSDDGKFFIMGNGTNAYAVKNNDLDN